VEFEGFAFERRGAQFVEHVVLAAEGGNEIDEPEDVTGVPVFGCGKAASSFFQANRRLGKTGIELVGAALGEAFLDLGADPKIPAAGSGAGGGHGLYFSL